MDVGLLDNFLKLLNSTWNDDYKRIFGYLDWAPKIANDLDTRRHTRDIGIIALDEDKFLKNFQGNFVYLGAFFFCLSLCVSQLRLMGNTNFYLAGKFTRDEIVSFFYPNAANPAVFKYPKGHLFRLLGCVDAAGLSDPYFFDEQGNPCFTVAKDGQSTDLTFGRQSELEAYTYVEEVEIGRAHV